jgi:hypothetical protein
VAVGVGDGVSVGFDVGSFVGSGVSVGRGVGVSVGGEVAAGAMGVTVGGTPSVGAAGVAGKQAETAIAVTTRIKKTSIQRLFAISLPPFQLIWNQVQAAMRCEDIEHLPSRFRSI